LFLKLRKTFLGLSAERLAPPAGDARERQRVGDVLRRGALVQEVGVLEDHADAASGLAQLTG